MESGTRPPGQMNISQSLGLAATGARSSGSAAPQLQSPRPRSRSPQRAQAQVPCVAAVPVGTPHDIPCEREHTDTVSEAQWPVDKMIYTARDKVKQIEGLQMHMQIKMNALEAGRRKLEVQLDKLETLRAKAVRKSWECPYTAMQVPLVLPPAEPPKAAPAEPPKPPPAEPPKAPPAVPPPSWEELSDEDLWAAAMEAEEAVHESLRKPEGGYYCDFF